MTDTNIALLDDKQSLTLEIYRLVQRDTAAAKKAIAFVNGDQLLLELFKDGMTLATGETGVVARTDKAIQIATEAYALFQ